MSSPFATYKRLATKGEIAQQIAIETIEEHQQARKGREEEPWDAQDTERMERLATLMIGPHKAVVIPHVLRAYPQMAALLEKKVGVVVSVNDEPPPMVGEIQVLGSEERFDWHPDAVMGQPVKVGDRVTFSPSDDGVAEQIELLEAAPQAVGQA